jgi:cold-inducible RNA-binding protein
VVDFEHSTREMTEGNVKIYVGNLSHDATEDDLRAAFEPFGRIDSVTVIKDKFTGQPRGFAFVEMSGGVEAQSAIQGLNGKELRGHSLTVNEARPREGPGRGGPKRGGRRS